MVNLAQKTYFLITGASRGIGQEMAIQMASKLNVGSVIVLLARSTAGLAKTKAAIEAKTAGGIQVLSYSIDLAKAGAAQFSELLQQSLTASAEVAANFEQALIVHNAGTVGDVSKSAKAAADTAEWAEYFHMNLFAAIALNCEFMKAFAPVPKVVVNVTSKCGIEPFVSMSFYCSGKAAREMYFRVLAVEEAEHGTLVLSYSPGPIDTDMTVQVQRDTFDAGLASYFKQQRDTKTMLTVDQTTAKFIQVLEEQKFKSGDHMDYFD